MRVLIVGMAAVTLIVGGSAYAAPANDNRTSAAAIAVTSASSGTTAGATLEPGEPLSQWCQGVGTTVWFVLQPTQAAPVAISTAGSNFDTMLTVYRAAGGDLYEIDCDDDSGTHRQSFVSLPAAPGDTFFIQLGGWHGATGTYRLHVTYGLRAGGPGFVAGAGADAGYQEAEFTTGVFGGGTFGANASGSYRVEAANVLETSTCAALAVPVLVVDDCV